jgi:hypothetical protein
MSWTEQATSSPSHIQLITDALADYARITGIDLSESPFAATLEQSNSPEAILQLFQGRERTFKGSYRDGNRGLMTCLSPVVNVLQAFSEILGEEVSQVSDTYHPANLLTWPCQVPFSPTTAVLASIDVLLAVRPLNSLFNWVPCDIRLC